MSARGGNELRAGVFVLIGLAVLAGAIFLLGQKDSLFSRNAVLYANFRDISGLVVGAPVRLAGLDVGTVTGIAFPDDLSKQKARVTLAVQSQYMPRVRKNSQAFVDSNGLLGDKIVHISMGDVSEPQLDSGDTLPAGETLTFEALSHTIKEAIESVRGVTEGVNSMIEDLNESGVQEDIVTIAGSLARILNEVQSGKGLAHEVIYDRKYAQQFGAILGGLEGLTATTRRALGRLDDVLAEVQTGDGTLHEVVYGKSGQNTLEQLELAAREIGEVVREVREGDGLVHTLIYAEDKTNFLSELNEVAVTVNRLTQEIDKGRGTVGGLIKDPTVYEDLKTVLGNVKRNVLFKALVRLTIERDDLRKAENAPRAQLDKGAAPRDISRPQTEGPAQQTEQD